jgi:hypothetical protein
MNIDSDYVLDGINDIENEIKKVFGDNPIQVAVRNGMLGLVVNFRELITLAEEYAIYKESLK